MGIRTEGIHELEPAAAAGEDEGEAMIGVLGAGLEEMYVRIYMGVLEGN